MPELSISKTQSGSFDVFLSVLDLEDRGCIVSTEIDSVKISVVLYQDKNYIKLCKFQLSHDYPYAVSLTCPKFSIKNEKLYPGCRHISLGHPTHENIFDNGKKSIKFNIKIEKLPSPPILQTSLYEDTDMTDFELSAEGGSVKVHRVVLSVTSPVFKAMLTSDWKEASEGRVEVPDTTKETLEHLKKYMYMRSIEKDISCENLLQLLRLASYYMMPDMEQDCLLKIEEHITEKNIWSLWNAVTQLKNGKLMIAILRNMNEEKLSALEMEICKPEEAVTK